MTIQGIPLFGRRQSSFALILVLVAAFFLSGCNDKPTRDLIDQHAAEAQDAMKNMDHYAPAKHYNPLVVTDRVWAGNSAFRMHRGLPLPAKYETERGVALVSADPMSLADIASAISAQTGLPVRITDAGASANPSTPAASGSSHGTSSNSMPVAYEGPLSGLMEKVSGYFGVNWHYDGAVISISRFETRVFVMESLPGTQNVEEGLSGSGGASGGGSSGGSSGGGGGSGSSSSASQTNTMTQNAKFSVDLKYWDELGQTLNAMVGGTGSIVVSPSMGTVTITTTPEIMRTVATYLSQENQRLSRQIAINIEIYSVSLSEGNDFTLAFNTALKRLTNVGANVLSAGNPASPVIAGAIPFNSTGAITGGGSLNVAILNPNTVGQVSDVFTALSSIGDTTKIVRFPLVTLNNKPVSRFIGEQVAYVQSTQSSSVTTSSATTLPSTTVTTSNLNPGFTVQLTPRLLDDGRILLEYSLSMVDIKAINQYNSVNGTCTSATTCNGGSGSGTVQLPDTVNRSFIQQSVLKSGSMLLLGGAEEEDLQHNSQGVGDPFNYMLGGGTAAARSHTMLFMAITPQVLNEPHSEQE